MSEDRANHVDVQTGAFVRAYFEEELARAAALARRAQEPLSLLHIDVDDMQEHNDLHGNHTLDESLSTLAGVISDVVDGRGPIARLGGDEFGVLLEGVTKAQAQQLAEELRRAVCRRFDLEEGLSASAAGALHLTVSVGVAALLAHEPPGNLLDAAESACRRAKQAGRNAVVCR